MLKKINHSLILLQLLINKTPQADGVEVLRPEQGSDHDKAWDPDEEENEE